MSLPFTESECFFVAILVFVVVGFQRGWRKELVSLVFVLLAVFLVQPQSGKVFLDVIARILGSIVYIFNPQGAPAASNIVPPAATDFFLGPLGSLVLFAGLMAIGYLVGNRAFPAKPATPQERLIGIVPAVVSGAFVLAFLSGILKSGNRQGLVTIALFSPDPGNYVPIIFVIAIVALVVALIAARAKKAPAKK